MLESTGWQLPLPLPTLPYSRKNTSSPSFMKPSLGNLVLVTNSMACLNLGSTTLPASMAELIDDCYCVAYQPETLSESRRRYAAKFALHLQSLHCLENLKFLVEVLRYEDLYEKDEKGTLSSSCLAREVLKQSLQRVMSLRSEQSFAGSTHAPFAFDFDHDDVVPGEAAICDPWATLRDQQVEDDDDNDIDDVDDDDNGTNIERSNSATPKILEIDLLVSGPLTSEQLLRQQWELVMSRFVRENSHEQVNLCDSTYKEIIGCDGLDVVVHSPRVLEPAKCEILQLVRENAYSSFLSAQRKACNCNCQLETSKTRSASPEVRLPTLSVDSRYDIKLAGLPLIGTTSPVASSPPTPTSANSATPETTILCPAPVVRRRATKINLVPETLLSPFSIFKHLKTPGNMRLTQLVPHLQASSVAHSEQNSEDECQRLGSVPPSSSPSPSLLNKFFKKKRSPV